MNSHEKRNFLKKNFGIDNLESIFPKTQTKAATNHAPTNDQREKNLEPRTEKQHIRNHQKKDERSQHGSERGDETVNLKQERLRKTFGANPKDSLQDFLTYVDKKVNPMATDEEIIDMVGEAMRGEASSHYFNVLHNQKRSGVYNWEKFKKSLEIRIEPKQKGMTLVLQGKYETLSSYVKRWENIWNREQTRFAESLLVDYLMFGLNADNESLLKDWNDPKYRPETVEEWLERAQAKLAGEKSKRHRIGEPSYRSQFRQEPQRSVGQNENTNRGTHDSPRRLRQPEESSKESNENKPIDDQRRDRRWCSECKAKNKNANHSPRDCPEKSNNSKERKPTVRVLDTNNEGQKEYDEEEPEENRLDSDLELSDSDD